MPCLVDLPPEIRDEIFRLVLANSSSSELLVPRYDLPPLSGLIWKYPPNITKTLTLRSATRREQYNDTLNHINDND